jgi:YD repeat-containing protein
VNSRYNGSHRRLSAKVVVNGVVVHNGSYSYDGGGRLAQVVDGATNQTEVYGWNEGEGVGLEDGTLASAPGPGYTRGFVWNEEGQLVGIKHNGVLVYQYGYGADGNRRWRKDLVNNVWVWYPCGVACSAGELVEEVSDLSGGVWNVQALYLRAGGGCSSLLVRRNGEYHHGDVLGNKGVITDGSGNVLSSNVYDAFGVSMFTSGSAQTPYRPAAGLLDEEGLLYSGSTYFKPNRALLLRNDNIPRPESLIIPVICAIACAAFGFILYTCWSKAEKACKKLTGAQYWQCMYNELFRCACKDKKHPVDEAACKACLLCLVLVLGGIKIIVPLPSPIPVAFS